MPMPMTKGGKGLAAAIAAKAEPVEPETESEETAEVDPFETAGEDILAAVKADDAKGIAAALKAAFEMME